MAGMMNPVLTLDDVYPVGSIYMSVNTANPAALFGGVWERIKERFLLAAGDTHTAGSTGGEFEHTLTVEEMPRHVHSGLNVDGALFFGWENGSDYGINFNGKITTSNDVNRERLVTGWSGNSKSHNITPPYLAVYMWQRTA